MRIPFLNPRPREVAPRYRDNGIVLRDVGESAEFQAQITEFWNSLSGWGYNPRLVDNVWSANKCIHLNSAQIASMPLRFHGSYEPAWVSSPDPAWFPNGISSALYAAVRSLYGYGDAYLLVTSRYANGYAAGWTVLDPATVSVRVEGGLRAYRVREIPLNAADVVQISRTPGPVTGQSALQAYGAPLLSAIASSDLSRSINEGGIPTSVLKSSRKLTEEQADALKAQWVTKTASRHGAPAVLPPEIDFETLSFSPKDLMLLDLQQFDARVIASAFGVPPAMLNLPLEGGLTYQNPAQMIEAWWRNELRPTAKFFADALGASMLPRGSWVEFDTRDALAPDFKTWVESWKILLDAGVVTAEEFRAAVLRIPPQPADQSLQDFLVPPSAGTSGETGGAVVPLRPTQEAGG